MKKQTLLINPWIYDFAAYDFGIKPLGLLRIASRLRQNSAVSFVDCLSGCARSKMPSGFSKLKKVRVETPSVLGQIKRPYFRYGISIDNFKNRLSCVNRPSQIYITSGMTYWYQGVKLAIRILRELFPGVPITLGGIYATLCFEHATLFSGADEVHRGDYLTGDLEGEFPAYDLLEERDVLPIRTSKGCPFRCSYCASAVLNGEFAQRDPVGVFEELMYCRKEFGTRTFVFYDDALFHEAHTGIKKLLRIIEASGERFNFYTPNGLHARFIDEEIAHLLRRTGFSDLRLSLETSDEKIQEATGSKVDNSDIERSIILLKEAGFEKKDIGVYILTGAPWISIDATKEDILYVNSLGAKAVLASYSPIPLTRDYEELLGSGIIKSNLDPLWHNKAIFSDKLMPGMADEIQDLRRFAARINS
ncbi:MAG: B12-binding domain-containing radical SAM protein [Candidatus Omnitrophota bacterium]